MRRHGPAAGILVAVVSTMLVGCAPARTVPDVPSAAASPSTAQPTAPTGSTTSAATETTQPGTLPAPSTRAHPTTSGAAGPGLAGFSSQPVSVGRLLLTTLRGSASGVTMRVWVWLPPAYDDPAHAHDQFPVLTLFPGGDGVSYTQFFDPQKVGIVASGAAAGTLSPFIIVEPQLQPSTTLDTKCTDLPGLPKVGTFMETEVPAVVRVNFRVRLARTGWGIGGVSSGAYCANRLLFARPDVWSVGASLGGYFVIDTHLPGGHTAAALATSAQSIAASRPPAVTLRAWVATGDPHAMQQNKDFFKMVRPPTRAELEVVPGAHTWVTFQRLLPGMFAFFTEHLDHVSPG